jgi:hypothetical protein
MHESQLASPGSMALTRGALGEPLGPGELGILLARAGVGKTACLTHIALEHLLQGDTVLHVCIDELPEKIKVWYHEFLKNLAASEPGEDLVKLQYRIEPLRFILAYLHQSFNPAKLEQSIQNLKEQAKFQPSLLVIDGLDFDRVPRSLVETLKDFAARYGLSMWMSARVHRHVETTNERGIPYPCHEMDDLFKSIVLLEAVPGVIRVKVLKQNDQYGPHEAPISLDPQTFLIQRS